MKKITYLIAILSAMTINLAFADDIEDLTINSSILGATSTIENPIHVINEEDLNSVGTRSLGESIDNLLGVTNTDFGSIVGNLLLEDFPEQE